MDWDIVLIGLVVVFGALFLLSLLISLFGKTAKFINSRKINGVNVAISAKEATNNNIEETLTEKISEDSISEDELSEDELVAILTAAIQSCFRATPHSNLIIKSYKRVDQTIPVWNRVARESSAN